MTIRSPFLITNSLLGFIISVPRINAPIRTPFGRSTSFSGEPTSGEVSQVPLLQSVQRPHFE